MSKELRIYKPKKTGDGAASKVQMIIKDKGKYKEYNCFWEITKQTGVDKEGNASFAWSKDKDRNGSITVKMGLPDIAEFLLVLAGKKEEAKLFHKNTKGNTAINFKKYNDGFAIQISNQVDKVLTKHQHLISGGEGLILEILLKDYLVKYHEV